MAIEAAIAALELPYREALGVDMIIGRAGALIRGELNLEFDVFLVHALAAHGTRLATAGPSPHVLGTVVGQAARLHRISNPGAEHALITHFFDPFSPAALQPCLYKTTNAAGRI